MNDFGPELLRQTNAVLCTLAFAGLLWRLIGRWPIFPTLLARVVVGLFAALELLVALGAARAATTHVRVNEVHYALFVHSVVTVAVIYLWPVLLTSPRTPREIHHPDGNTA